MDSARMSHYSNLQTHHSPEKARRGGERGRALGVPTALARQCLPGSEPSECAHTPGPMACARVEGTRRKKRAWQARRRGLPAGPPGGPQGRRVLTSASRRPGCRAESARPQKRPERVTFQPGRRRGAQTGSVSCLKCVERKLMATRTTGACAYHRRPRP